MCVWVEIPSSPMVLWLKGSAGSGQNQTTRARASRPTSASLIGPTAHLHFTGAEHVFMLNCRPEARVMAGLWQGCWTEGLHFPPSLPPSIPPSLYLSTSPSILPPPPFITVADGCRWIPHNHVRTAPPIPIHLFKNISSDRELHKDKGSRADGQGILGLSACKQVFLVPRNVRDSTMPPGDVSLK